MAQIQILLAILGLYVTIFIALRERRPLAWFVAATTLILPNALLTWLAMQISARLLAQATTDISSFVTQIAWSVGAFSALYPLIWGIKIYPPLKIWVSKFSPPANGGAKNISDEPGGNAS